MAELALNPGWLPWDRNSSEERLFLKALAIAMGVSLLLGTIVPFIPVAEPKREEAEAIPPRLARMLLERKPPPPAKPKVEPKGEEKPVEPKVEQRPLSEQERRVAAAREKAAASGVLAMSNELAALSSVGVLSKATSRVAVSSGGSQWVQQEAAMVSNAAEGSGGIDTTTLVREKSEGAMPQEHATTTVVQQDAGEPDGASLLVAKDELANVTRTKKAAKRNPDVISETLDRNKGAVYAIYNRALRQNALLAGNVVFAITIEPSGKVSACKVVSSELHDEELERKLAARISMIDFGAEAVPAVTVKWPLNFLPN